MILTLIDILRIADLIFNGVAVVLTLVDILRIADLAIGSSTPHVLDAARLVLSRLSLIY